MNKIKLIRIISIFFLIFGVIIVLITNFKDSYANENNIYTREELQEFVVSTALSFYYNQEYSNYEQYAMDDKEYNPIYYNNETKKNAKYESGTFYFRTFNQTPESTSRANYYNIDCDSFTSIVFINSLGYDFSEYYYLSDRKYFDSSEIGYYNTNESVENFKNGYKNYGLGSITPYTKISNEQIPEEDGLLIYNYNFLHNETEETKEMLKQEIKNILQPGDQLLWTYQNIETGMKNGHTGIYIGDKFEDAGGVIDASGVDYNFDNNPNASGEGIGSDYFAVRYNSYSTIEQNIFESSINHVLSVRIFRPINEFCEKDTCKLHIDENATQRPNFSNLKVEQYASKDNKSLSLYNSVNSQDIITYNLNITNKSDFEFCSNGRYATYQDAKDYCEKNNFEWKNTKKDNYKSYMNLTIKGEIPEGTEYIENSCTNDCIVENNTIIWNNIESLETDKNEHNYSYKVRVITKDSQIINNGMTIIDKETDKFLKMGNITTKINPTLTNKSIEIIEKIKNTVDSKINYTEQDLGNYKNNILESNTLNISQSEYIKLLYYNYLGVDLEYITHDNVKNAIFKIKKDLEENNIYYKKTEEEIESLDNETYKSINKMLVPGMYGGRILKGNDNKDRLKYLRSNNPKYVGERYDRYENLNDLELGDIIIYYTEKTISMHTYMYYGINKYGNPIIIGLEESGPITYEREEANKKSGYKIIKGLFASDLFVVLRPSRVYGTTVVYDYNYEGKEDETYIAYGTYKELNNPERSGGYKVEYVCGEGIDCPEEKESKFIFEGWYADSSYNEKIEEEDTLKSSEAHKIYAKWGNEKIILPIVEKEGYRFLGWYRDSEYSYKEGAGGEEYEVSGNKVLYARLEKEEVEITSDELEIENGNIYLEEGESEIERYKSLIEIEGESNYRIEVYSPEEERIESGRIYTGSITRIYREDEELGEYRNIVKGDVNRTGTVSMADVMKIASYLTEEGVMEEEYNKMAADINRDNNIGMNDIMRIVNYLIEGGSL